MTHCDKCNFFWNEQSYGDDCPNCGSKKVNKLNIDIGIASPVISESMDKNYIKEKLNLFLRDLEYGNYKPDEAYRQLRRITETIQTSAKNESEFARN